MGHASDTKLTKLPCGRPDRARNAACLLIGIVAKGELPKADVCCRQGLEAHERILWGLDLRSDVWGLRVCVFDVNGVLIDSNPANAQAMAQAFSEEPLLQEKIVQLYLQLTGLDRGTKIRLIQERLIGVPFDEGEFDLRWKRFKHLGSLSMLKAPPTEGCQRVLMELGKREILRIALSNTPVAELKVTLAAHSLEYHLDQIRGGGDWPKSDSLRQLLEELPFAPSECLFFGDGKGDLAAARLNSVPFVAIDPGTGEFIGEEGFAGPYRHLFAWGQEALDLRSHG
jgi:phosphoglycolate phosphatase-like HAD superfamily hydrolase